MTSIVSNYMYRRGAERVQTEEPDDIREETPNRRSSDNNSIVEDGEEGQFIGRPSATESRVISAGNDGSESSSQTVPMLEPEGENHSNDAYIAFANSAGGASPEIEIASDAEAAEPSATRTSSRRRFRGLTLRDLEEEREIVQRRTGGCVLLSSFILLRLWIQALVTGDFGLLLLCLVLTSWTAKFVRYTREREEELNRMINEWDETANEEEPALNDARLTRMSFQSQLALAIMQSQIQMMEGGYGHPDGGESRPGVAQEARKNWDMFEFKSPASLGGDVGSNGDGGGKTLDDEEPTCSICLCEYEKGDKVIKLPCGHVFHADCINSWTEHNTRCPLCNADLTVVAGNEVV